MTELAISHGSRRALTDTAAWRLWVRKASCMFEAERQELMKTQRKNAGGGKSEQHPCHPQPKLSSVQSTEGCAHQESVSTAINDRARIDDQPSKNSWPVRNESSCVKMMYINAVA